MGIVGVVVLGDVSQGLSVRKLFFVNSYGQESNLKSEIVEGVV